MKPVVRGDGLVTVDMGPPILDGAWPRTHTHTLPHVTAALTSVARCMWLAQ
jgi:hypothetical protein